MKNDLTTGAWQDNFGCPINIILFCTSDVACMAMDNASMYSLALAMSWGGSPCNKVLRMFPTIWCILLHTALDWWFYDVVHTSLMWQFCNNNWNCSHVSSIQLLGVILHAGFFLNKQANKQTINMTCFFWLGILVWDHDLASWIGTSNASNLCRFLQTWVFHGPNRSTAHSSNRIDWTSCSDMDSYCLPSNLFLRQKSQLRLGCKFWFLVQISGTPSRRGIPIPFPIPDILAGFFLKFQFLESQKIRILICKIPVICWRRNSLHLILANLFWFQSM